jgi:hypothetical protein
VFCGTAERGNDDGLGIVFTFGWWSHDGMGVTVDVDVVTLS